MESSAGDRGGRYCEQGEGKAAQRSHDRQRRALNAPARDIAPAKINLALHVRGDLPDGRRAIETIFAFCTDGDRLEARGADEISLGVTGPFAAGLRPEDNLVMKAAHALAAHAGVTQGAALTLEKRLPVAAGVGGGSADAAAALRLLTS